MPRIQLAKQSPWIAQARLKVEDDSDVEPEEYDDQGTEAGLRLQAERDEAFMSNLDYLVGKDGPGVGKLIEATEDEPNEARRNFICFSRDGNRVYIKKASLIWWLSADERKVSSDRVWRFVDDREKPSEVGLQTGDFVEMKYGKKMHIVQILAFRFADGKTFYGDRYDGKDDREVEALCNFYTLKRGIVTASEAPLRYINVKNRTRRIFLKRDLESGQLRMV